MRNVLSASMADLGVDGGDATKEVGALAQRISLEPHDIMLLAGIGVFLVLGAALLIFDAIRNLRFLTFSILSSALHFGLFSYTTLVVAPTGEPLLTSIAAIAALSVLSAFGSAAVYWVQKKYIIAARNAENPESSKRKPGQCY